MIVRTTRAAVALLCATAVAVLPAAPAQADQIRDDQWHLRYLKVAEAHKISQGEGVTVAVVDTGVDPHPDLRNNLLQGTDSYPGGKGNGRADLDGHGTRMAGLVVAHGRSGNRGALGIAPQAKLLPVRVVQAPGSNDPDNLAAGIEWATANGARVISISSTGTSTTRLREAVEAALQADIVVVAGSGNRPGRILVGFPAAYEGVVAVAAIDRNGSHSDFSVTGDKVVIAAPGEDILSTAPDGRYLSRSGTSPSTAIVAGAAALIRSKYPDLSAKEVVHRLTATADDKGAPGRDEEYGYGVLDIVAALTEDVPPLEGDAQPTGAATPEPTQTSNAAPDGGNASNVLTTVALVGCGAFVLFALLITFLVIMLVRRRKQPAPRAPY
ncbi:type VII secretion-associated serine protease mycosin [Plantactinospora sp. B5E13]|uniref:type VII secretion-associated serine protease mycosin n=1 Tax=Plantactinospora sp. B5E13 TaxID=3153758 RepID=UPI00325DE38C